MSQTPHEQALIAWRWLNGSHDKIWTDFPRYWMAFNALYKIVRQKGDSEEKAVGEVILRYFSNEEANDCLKKIRWHIRDLTRLPPGDDRLDPKNPDYRKKSTDQAVIVNGNDDPKVRLSSLMKIVYQVRCNLLHGSKDPTVLRDYDLINCCTPILEVVVPKLQEIMYAFHEAPKLESNNRRNRQRHRPDPLRNRERSRRQIAEDKPIERISSFGKQLREALDRQENST